MSKFNKLRIIAASIGLVILAAVVFGVMLRGDDGAADAAATTPASTSAPEASSAPASEPAPSDTAPATAESAVTTAPIVDDVFGNTITPTAIVRDFQASTPAPAGGEYILVNVDVTAGNVYYGGFSETELALAAAGSDEEYPATAKTSVIADDMRAAGYTPFEDLESGATGQGWVAFILVNAPSVAVTHLLEEIHWPQAPPFRGRERSRDDRSAAS